MHDFVLPHLTRDSASRIIDSMDTSVNPCDDFYKFACGGWKESKHISDDQTGITEFGALRENLNRKMRGSCTSIVSIRANTFLTFFRLTCHSTY
jgi:predicted metalloendopeptidase